MWDAFFTLTRSRPPGFDGPASIPISEIYAYCAFNDIRNPGTKTRILNAVQALDAEFLAWGEKQRKNRDGAKG